MSHMTCEGRGEHQITGASFSLHPMSDDFIAIIEAALNDTDTSKVWLKTDDVTTTVRGKAVHVFDVTKSICVRVARTGKHVAFQATYSVGCPGDAEGSAYIALDDESSNRLEARDHQLFAAAKFSLYPLSGVNYMDTIYEQIEKMKEYVDVTTAHYSTKLTGGLLAIFNGLESIFQNTVDAGANHTVMTVTISINSPSHQAVD